MHLALVLSLLLLAGASQAATNVSQNGITVTFDTDYTTGTFVDGSPWVLENTPGGGVDVTATSPAYSGGRHGYEVDPVGDFVSPASCDVDNAADTQSLDNRAVNPSHCFLTPPSLPLTVDAGETFYKVVSRTDAGACDNPRTCLETAMALSVVASTPPADAFRPPFVGGPKPIFRATYDIDAKLPTLEDAPANQISLAEAEAVFGDGGPWGRQENGSLGRLNNRQSIRNYDGSQGGGSGVAGYGCQLGARLVGAALRTTQSGTAAQKDFLVKQVIQKGIDMYYAQLNHTRTWFNAGGCVTPGMKPVIMYTGYMLDGQTSNGEAANDMLNYTGGSDEDTNHMRVGSNEAIWGFTGRTCYTTPGPNCGGGPEVTWPCDGLADAGACQYGTHPCTSGCGSPNPQPELDDMRASGLFSMAAYQRMTDARFGSAALAVILNLESNWNNDIFFEYINRISTPPWNAYCSGHCDPYLNSMYTHFGCDSAACVSNRDWTPGAPGAFACTATCTCTAPCEDPAAASCLGSQVNGTGPFTYAWDTDNDLLYDDSTDNPVALTSLVVGTYPIGLEVTDTGDGGATTTCSDSFTVTSPGAAPEVTSFTLVVAPGTDVVVEVIDGGEVFALADGPYAIAVAVDVNTQSIRYTTWSAPGSEDPFTNVYSETTEPFCFPGDDGVGCRDDLDRNLNGTDDLSEVGQHTLCVTPYPEPNQGGTPGTEFCRTFTIVDAEAILDITAGVTSSGGGGISIE